MTDLPAPDPAPPAPREPTVVRTVDPDGDLERIAVWWDGTSMDDIAWVEILFGPRNWRTTGERKVMTKSRPVALGGIEFSAPTWQPDPATLQIRGVDHDGGERWYTVPHGVWLTGNRPYQPPVRISAEQVTGVDPALARMVDAVIEGKAESAMTIERKRDDD
jgi:hypothetical protein